MPSQGLVRTNFLKSLRQYGTEDESSQLYRTQTTWRSTQDYEARPETSTGEFRLRMSTSSKGLRPNRLDLAVQKTQELPLEISRYNGVKVTKKHMDKHRYTLGFSRMSARTSWFDRDPYGGPQGGVFPPVAN